MRQELDFIIVGMTSLNGLTANRNALESRLSAQDRARAGRFRQLEDRARFVLGRALLAALLKHELYQRFEVLELALTDKGRPYLPQEPTVQFSITHAGGCVAVALALGAQVGIDIESLDRRIDFDPLAARIFNCADLQRFQALPAARRTRAFFHAWTGKEAVLKARGVGLFGGVQEISVPPDEASSTICETRHGQPIDWCSRPLPVPDGYVGAVVWDDPAKPVQFRTYSVADLSA
jgi:4'-phosphopantetheinyl transferase